MNPQAVMALRERLGLNIRDFARLVGSDARAVTRWEAGENEPATASRAVMMALEKVMETSPHNATTIKALAGEIVGETGSLFHLLMVLLVKWCRA